MKRLSVAFASAVTVAAVLVTAQAPSAARDGRAHCAPAGARVVLANARVRVYRDGPEVVACWVRTGRETSLGYRESGGSGGFADVVRQLRLAGRFVAHSLVTCRDRCSVRVVVTDARTSRTRARSVPAGLDPNAVRDLELRPNGSVAWIGPSSAGEGAPLEVRARDASGERTLDSGADVEPHSLALGGATLYWTKAGRPVSAQLR
jgi:hypothetical protein